MWQRKPLRDALLQYQQSEARRLWAIYEQETAYNNEPPTVGQSVGPVAVEVTGTSGKLEKYSVQSRITGVLNHRSSQIFERWMQVADLAGVPLHTLMRSGGPFSSVNNKRFGNLENVLKAEANGWFLKTYGRDSVFEMSGGHASLLARLDRLGKRACANWEKAQADPSLLLVAKQGSTGTGYTRPDYSPVENLARHIRRPGVVKMLQQRTEQFYDGLIALTETWPYSGGVFGVDPPFVGISGGSRSDVDVDDFTFNPRTGELDIRVTAGSRLVTSAPGSASSSKGLNNREAQHREMMTDAPSRICFPFEPVSYDVCFGAPVATASFMADGTCDMAVLSLDAGMTSGTHEATHTEWGGLRVTALEEQWKAGADQTVLVGCLMSTAKVLQSANFSGFEGTTLIYIDSHGRQVSHYLTSYSQAGRFYQLGDDLGISMEVDAIPRFLSDFREVGRGKGMNGNFCFIAGKQTYWHSPDRVIIGSIPRLVKTISSANFDDPMVPKSIRLSERQVFGVSQHRKEAGEIAEAILEEHPYLYFFEGSPKEYISLMKRQKVADAASQLIKLGVGSQHALGLDVNVEQPEATD